jgi:hypothetical protein
LGRVPIVLSSAWFGQHAPAFFPNSTHVSASTLHFRSPCSGLPALPGLRVILNPAHHVCLCGKNKERFCHISKHHTPWVVGPLRFGPETRICAHSLPGKQACRRRG